jgi:hypothetical protein
MLYDIKKKLNVIKQKSFGTKEGQNPINKCHNS